MRKTLLEGLPHSMMETILWLYHTLQDLLERLKGDKRIYLLLIIFFLLFYLLLQSYWEKKLFYFVVS